MPIKDKSLYPATWNAISLRIRERAGNRCETCGVANGAVGARDKYGAWHDEHDIHYLNSDAGWALFGEFPDMIRIVLTVGHIDQNPANNDPANLRAWCQRCHLRHDQPHNIVKRKRTLLRQKAKRIAATGQGSLFDEVTP